MGINMTKVRDTRIKNTSIRIMFYNIPCIQNQVVFRKLSYVVKIFRREGSHLPNRLLTAWCNHPSKHGMPLLTNKMYLDRNPRLIISDVDKTGLLLCLGCHALNTDLLATLKHMANTTPDGPPNTPDADEVVPPQSNYESSLPPLPHHRHD